MFKLARSGYVVKIEITHRVKRGTKPERGRDRRKPQTFLFLRADYNGGSSAGHILTQRRGERITRALAKTRNEYGLGIGTALYADGGKQLAVFRIGAHRACEYTALYGGFHVRHRPFLPVCIAELHCAVGIAAHKYAAALRSNVKGGEQRGARLGIEP